MAPQSRGNGVPPGFQSKSTPNLTTLRSLDADETTAIATDVRSTTSPHSQTLSTTLPGPESAGSTGNEGEEQDYFTLRPPDGSQSDDDSDDESPPAARRLYTSRSQSHLPPHASMLFPPFYNRPPTPLPPSPSLTSLLRPSFSTTTSRPTTPESSDADLPYLRNGSSTPTSTTNLASITKSAQQAPMVPRASPKVPTYEYYGFALYLASSAAFLMYLLWAYVPSPLLHQMGIHYYPNRWWALAGPCWLVVLVLYIYVALASYNTRYLTLPMSSCENLVDDCASVAVVHRRTGKIARGPDIGASTTQADKDTSGKRSNTASRRNSVSDYQFSASDQVDWKSFWSIGTDAVLDVPIGGVCEILYGSED